MSDTRTDDEVGSIFDLMSEGEWTALIEKTMAEVESGERPLFTDKGEMRRYFEARGF